MSDELELQPTQLPTTLEVPEPAPAPEPEQPVTTSQEFLGADNPEQIVKESVTSRSAELGTKEQREQLDFQTRIEALTVWGNNLAPDGKAYKVGERIGTFIENEEKRAEEDRFSVMLHEKAQRAGKAPGIDQMKTANEQFDSELDDYVDQLIGERDVVELIQELEGTLSDEDLAELQRLQDEGKTDELRDYVKLAVKFDDFAPFLMERLVEEASEKVSELAPQTVENAQASYPIEPNEEVSQVQERAKQVYRYVFEHPDNSLEDFLAAVMAQNTYSHGGGYGYDFGDVPLSKEKQLPVEKMEKAFGESDDIELRLGFIQALFEETTKSINPFDPKERALIDEKMALVEEKPEEALAFFTSIEGKFLMAKLFQGKAFESSTQVMGQWFRGELAQYSSPTEKVAVPKTSPNGITHAFIEKMLSEIL